MSKVVIGITLDKNHTFIDKCIESLLHNTHKPDSIQVTYTGTGPIPSFKSMSSTEVQIYHAVADYGAINAVITFCSTHTEGDTVLIIVDGSCTYPPHLIQEYLNSAPELHKSLISQVPEANGSIYGLAGVIMIEDNKKNLDHLFESLISKSDTDIEEHEKLSVMSQTVNNATVHYLDPVGSIMMRRDQLHDDFMGYISHVWSDRKDLSTDVLLSNYFASKKIVRTQICNIFINRFMMARMGCFDKYTSPDPIGNNAKYVDTVRHLRSLNAFRAYD